MTGNVDIFCVTYWKDAPWLEYMLRSIQKYARGFRQTIVVYPSRDVGTLSPICKRFPFVREMTFEETGNGHMHQNQIKSSCDLFSDADYFFHIDSDCVLIEDVCPEDYFTNGKPDILFDHYTNINSPWQGITESALGFPCPRETMRSFPFIYERGLYAALRQHIEKRHRMSFADYCQRAPGIGAAFRGYSEFCALGSYASHVFPERYHFYDSKTHSKHKATKAVKQFWSHSGCTEFERETLEQLTKGYDRAEPEALVA